MRFAGVVCVVVVAAIAGATAGVAAERAGCRPTPNDGGGPDRGTMPLRAKIGTGHVLTGVVLSPTCAPIRGAQVSFWQANANGVYTARSRGGVLTGKLGRFRFEGPMPKGYDGRPGHIHIKVEAPDYEPLYTRYEPHGTRRGHVRLVLTPSAV